MATVFIMNNGLEYSVTRSGNITVIPSHSPSTRGMPFGVVGYDSTGRVQLMGIDKVRLPSGTYTWSEVGERLSQVPKLGDVIVARRLEKNGREVRFVNSTEINDSFRTDRIAEIRGE